MTNLLLTDVDGTLTNESMVLNHAGFLIEKGIISDDGSFKAWKEDVKNESLITAVAENYRSGITGLKESDMLAREFVVDFFSQKNKWYETIYDLITYRANGFDVYLVTGSSDFIIKHLADILQVDYFATEYLKDENDCFTGEVNGMFAENQKDDCVQWNININDYENVHAWGDTASDYGLFKHATYTRLVEPTKQTLETLITKIKIDEIV